MDYAKREERILKTWKKEKAFEKSVARRRGKKRFIFYEGPPTANGRPGVHHVLVRSIKDAFLRYKTMQGFLVERRGGWDTHGLPVELDVEKQLGLSSKQDIEKYGIEKFNTHAKKSVWRYKDEWEKLTDRIGFWLDQENAYITYTNEYIEGVWSVLKEAHRKKLLEEDFKVVPYCYRCGTALSSHEVAQGYQSVTENSVFVKFKVRGQKNTYILSWTTTPWTLPGNVALAVGEDIEYAKVREGDETYILAKDRVGVLHPENNPNVVVYETLKGIDLVGLGYEPLFNIPQTQNEKSHRVYAADFVNTEEGTGIVHTAVMYGEDDYQLGTKMGLPKVHTVKEDGRFSDTVPDGLSGKKVKTQETEKLIIDLLKERNLLFKEEKYTHDYPFCWRCGTPLLYYAKRSWFIRMSQLRDKLIAENKKINWVPAYLQEGRFGEWLREVKDWAISRERYWGTPLPVWQGEENKDHRVVISSVKELAKYARLRNRYVLFRHGEAVSNVKKFVSSYPEKKKNPLTPKGRKQVTAAIEKLRAMKPDLIVVSPVLRCVETAEILKRALGIPVVTDREFREIDTGEYNGRSIKEYWKFFSYNPFARWNEKPKEGETWRELRKRVVTVLRKIERKYQDKTIVIVSHGDPLFFLQAALLGFDEHSAKWGQNPEKVLLLFSYPKKGVPTPLRGGLLPFNQDGELDLHRPWIDEVKLSCPKCGEPMSRSPEVLDVWLDSGAMPFSTRNPKPFPADFICEAIDQTRGWFYTLLAVATVVGKERPYRNVICTGHVLDRQGKKMSKSKGNVVSPWEMIERYGADAVRWYFYTINQPWDQKRFDEKDVREAMNGFVGTLSNVVRFWQIYTPKNPLAGQAKSKKVKSPKSKKLTVLDRWILSRLNSTIVAATEAMDSFDITGATRAIDGFVDDLSNWYVRRSRSRFQQPSSKEDLVSGAGFLKDILETVALLTAPFTPFLADEIFRELGNTSSVHLGDFPKAKKTLIDSALEANMTEVRNVIASGLAARKNAAIPVRQPLAALATRSAVARQSDFAQLIQGEVNVKEVVPLGKPQEIWPSAGEEKQRVALDQELTPKLRAEGAAREFIRAVQELRKEAELTPNDRIILHWHTHGALLQMLEPYKQEIQKVVRAKKIEEDEKRSEKDLLASRKQDFAGATLWFGIKKA